MKLSIQRFCKYREPNLVMITYDIPLKEPTLLEALFFIKAKIDSTLTFNSGCRSEVCGSCAMRVNDKEVLACGYKVQEGDIITPLSKMEILKDLVVDHQKAHDTMLHAKSWLDKPSVVHTMTIEDEKRIEKQTDCILCSSCYSACPVFEVDGSFLGPFTLTRVYRYTNDVRLEDVKSRIDAVQEKGVWDCTLCGECTVACPQGIDPKNDILMLRTKSVQYGYSDPNFGGGDDDMFGGGFNPSF